MSAVVVIPARDESALIGRCLRSVGAERVIVVADSCVDDTAAIARAHGAEVIEIAVGSVGIARAIGCDTALLDPEVTWIANTDADSVVPRGWVAGQLALAASGSAVVVGTVRPEFSDLSAVQLRAWLATHPVGVANGHVHGANLGISREAYLAAGGFPPIPEHEDNDLVARLAALGFTITPTAELEVITSGRTFGRTPGGYARYLRDDLLANAARIA